MATTEALADRDTRTRVAKWVLGGLAVLAVAGAVLAYRGTPPQMGTDEDVFNTVDALYTAVRNHDAKRLAECETRLKAYRAAGKLPADAAESLDAVIAKARAGSWEAAAARLYDFMKAQRREGATGPAPQPKPSRKGAK
jgi:hypothetical protein